MSLTQKESTGTITNGHIVIFDEALKAQGYNPETHPASAKNVEQRVEKEAALVDAIARTAIDVTYDQVHSGETIFTYHLDPSGVVLTDRDVAERLDNRAADVPGNK